MRLGKNECIVVLEESCTFESIWKERDRLKTLMASVSRLPTGSYIGMTWADLVWLCNPWYIIRDAQNMHVSVRTGMDSSGRWWLLTARGSMSQENTTALSQVHWGKGTLGLPRPAYACSVKLPTTVHTDMRARNGKGNSKERKGSKTRSALVWFTYTLMTCLLLFIFWDKILLHNQTCDLSASQMLGLQGPASHTPELNT